MEVPFADSYPERLILSDGSVAKQVKNLFVLNFDTIDPDAQHAVSLKLAEFQLAQIDENTQPNNSIHMLWVKSLSMRSLKDNLDALRTRFPNVNWISPVYQFGSNDKTTFAPLPNTIIVKTSLVDTSVEAEFIRIGLERANREVAGYTFYQLSHNKFTVYAIAGYLRTLPPFQKRGSFYFENLPYYLPTLAAPNDAYWSSQQSAFDLIRIPQAWDIVGHSSVKVAVIDCGVNIQYADIPYINSGMRMDNLSLNATPHYRASRHHGTGVTALVSAKRNNQIGIAGVSAATVLPLALAANTDAEVAQAIWLSRREKVDIINMSIGNQAWRVSILDTAIENAHAAGILLLAASGNDGAQDTLPMPAAHEKVMAIGGSIGDSHDTQSTYAVLQEGTRWKGISVVAPSAHVATVDYDGSLWLFDGTSAACPLVTGVAALMKATSPDLTNIQIQTMIEKTADKISGPYTTHTGFPSGTHNVALGYGRVNAEKAILELRLEHSEVISNNRLYNEPEQPPKRLLWIVGALLILAVAIIFLWKRRAQARKQS